MNEFVRNTIIFGNIVGTDILDSLGLAYEILGFHYRVADAAKMKKDGMQGKYYKDFQKLKLRGKKRKKLPFNPQDIIPMNKDGKWFIDNVNPIFAEIDLKKKLEMVANLKEEIQLANIANINALEFFEIEILEGNPKSPDYKGQIFLGRNMDS